MKILQYTAKLNCDSYGPECEIDLSCDCSFSELQKLRSMHSLEPYKSLYLTDKEPKATKSDVNVKEPRFGSMITLPETGEQVYITKVIYNKPVVIVFWSDGKKTRSTCDKEDTWNPEFGLTLCVMKRFLPSEQINMLYKDWFVEDSLTKNSVVRTLKDVRKSQKNS